MKDVITEADIKRYQGKTVSQLIKLAQLHFNKYIRSRDSFDDGFLCISCGHFKTKDQMQAGHYFSAGHFSPVRFDENNVHAQCIKCNMYLSGNLIGYHKGLTAKIGEDEMKELEIRAKRRGFKFERYGLIEIILKYKAKCK